jgi:hypothetical protein
MRTIFLTIIFSIAFPFANSTYASVDYELKESRKCSSVFSYFEKKYGLPGNSLHAISLHETAKKHPRHNISLVWPWTVMNNKEGKSYHFRTPNEAIRYVRMQFMMGNNNIDVGCMQINLKHHPEAFSSLNQAFSPRSNIAYGAYFLSENRKKLGSMEKAIGRYHSATEHLAAKYRYNVNKINQSMYEYNANLRKVAYSVSYNKKYLNSYRKSSSQDLFTKKNDRYLVSRNKNSSKRINADRIQHEDWFESKVYQR